ncbi:hypothetical protein [Auritidibacter sp. NML100628]|uniref:hypothetical protein n=1 Tax=Auritidibacter sp. NML100628 TaxID=2170742 RepID=UPI000D73CEEB|nr:hypothetical protein [Auritidibacter sp. NML100628]PXA76242.1 hypothetical protein DCC24_07820 [Auritidibacter sp. NML100628]
MAIAVLMLHEISGYWGGLVTDFVVTALTIGSLVMAVIGLIGAVGYHFEGVRSFVCEALILKEFH